MKYPCSSFLIYLDKGGKPGRWLYRQITTQVVSFVEEELEQWLPQQPVVNSGFHRSELDVADALAMGESLPSALAPAPDTADPDLERPKKGVRNSVAYHNSLRQQPQQQGPRGHGFVSQRWYNILSRY